MLVYTGVCGCVEAYAGIYRCVEACTGCFCVSGFAWLCDAAWLCGAVFFSSDDGQRGFYFVFMFGNPLFAVGDVYSELPQFVFADVCGFVQVT